VKDLYIISEKAALLEEEAFLIRQDGGEIPEVAMHGAIYFLTEDDDGPGLELRKRDLDLLKQAVVERYRVIIRRDLDPANRDARHFRGMARCVANWQRLSGFCCREGLDPTGLKTEIGAALRGFLEGEDRDVRQQRRASCLNCTAEELAWLADALGLREKSLPPGWRKLCRKAEVSGER